MQFSHQLVAMVHLRRLSLCYKSPYVSNTRRLSVSSFDPNSFQGKGDDDIPTSEEIGFNLNKQSKRLGLSAVSRHIFLCADQGRAKCCSYKEGMESWMYLKKRLIELKLVGGRVNGVPHVARTKANCLQLCMNGKVYMYYVFKSCH